MPTDESQPKLTPNQILVLIVLMAEARELTNKDLTELAGFSLTGENNKKLEKLGLVETDRTHKPFSHTLTDKGWAVVRSLHSTTPPKEGRSAIRSLFTLLGNVNRSLDRLQVSHADFFKRTTERAADADPQALVRQAYADLAREPGAWVGLADLRERLTLDRAQQDETLKAMAKLADVRIIPVADTKNVTDRDRAGALRIGAEENHAIAIGRS